MAGRPALLQTRPFAAAAPRSLHRGNPPATGSRRRVPLRRRRRTQTRAAAPAGWRSGAEVRRGTTGPARWLSPRGRGSGAVIAIIVQVEQSPKQCWRPLERRRTSDRMRRLIIGSGWKGPCRKRWAELESGSAFLVRWPARRSLAVVTSRFWAVPADLRQPIWLRATPVHFGRAVYCMVGYVPNAEDPVARFTRV